jgi:hypothetical protein
MAATGAPELELEVSCRTKLPNIDTNDLAFEVERFADDRLPASRTRTRLVFSESQLAGKQKGPWSSQIKVSTQRGILESSRLRWCKGWELDEWWRYFQTVRRIERALRNRFGARRPRQNFWPTATRPRGGACDCYAGEFDTRETGRGPIECVGAQISP